MNLPLPDHTLRTNCKNCIFAEYEQNTQTDCSFGRIDKFKNNNKITEAYDNEKEFYVINGLCNLNRPNSWNDGVKDKDKAFKESSLTYKICIDCTDLDSNFKSKILKFINNDYYHDKYSIVLYHELNIDQSIKKDIIDIYKSSNKKIYITSCRNKDEYLHNSCMDSKESYTINILPHSDFDDDILSKLNDCINNDLRKGLVVKNKNIYIISNTIYKVENFENQHNSYIKTLEALLNKSQNTELYFEV